MMGVQRMGKKNPRPEEERKSPKREKRPKDGAGNDGKKLCW